MATSPKAAAADKAADVNATLPLVDGEVQKPDPNLAVPTPSDNRELLDDIAADYRKSVS